jgi:hypothetical protein
MKRFRKSNDITIEFMEGPEMTQEHVDAFTGLLCKWSADDWEEMENACESSQRSGLGSQPQTNPYAISIPPKLLSAKSCRQAWN